MPPENYQSSSMNSVKLQDTKLIHRNLLHSYTLAMKDQEEKLRKQSSISSTTVLQFSEYTYWASLGRFIHRYFILFDAMVNDIVVSNYRIILSNYSNS